MDEIKELVTQMICSYIIDELHDSDLADKAKEYIEKERMTFVSEQVGLEGGHYSRTHGIVLRNNADKNDLSLIGLIIHEIQHMFSDKISDNQSFVTEQVEEGFSDLFSELVINNYREKHNEEYKKAFPHSDYQFENSSLYFCENNFLRIVLETIRINSGKDTQAIKEYIFGDKNKFIEICEENLGQEFLQILKLQQKGGLYDKYNKEADEKLIELIANLDMDYTEESDELNARLFRQKSEILAEFKKISRIKHKLKENNMELSEIGLEELPIIKEICEQESVDGLGKTAVTSLIYKPIYRNILNKNSIQDLLKIKDIYGYFPAKYDAWDLINDSDEISKEEKVAFLEATATLPKISNDTIMNLLNENTIKSSVIQELLSEYLNKKWSKDDIDKRKTLLEKIKDYNKLIGDIDTIEGKEYKKSVQKLVKRYNSAINELKESRFATEDLKNMPNVENIEEMDINIKLKGDDPLRLIYIQDNYRDVNVINKENVKNMTLAFLEDIQSRGANTDNIMSQLFSQHKNYGGSEKYNKLMIETLQEVYVENEVNNIFGRENISEFIKLIDEDRIRFDRDDIENSKICLELKQKAEKELEKLPKIDAVEEQKEETEGYGKVDTQILGEELHSDDIDSVVEENEMLEETVENVEQEVSSIELTQTIEHEAPKEEEVPLEQEVDSRAGNDTNIEQLQTISSENSTVSQWMQRFNSWYNAIERVSQNAKAKFVKMKADIVKVIGDKLKNKTKSKEIQENEK